MNRILAFAVLVSFGVSSVLSMSTAYTHPSYRMTYGQIKMNCFLKEAQIFLNAPILINCILDNKSSETMSVDLGANFEEAYKLAMTLPNNKIISLPQLTAEGTAALGKFSLPPGSTYQQELLLNKWFDFTEPGHYSLFLELPSSIYAERNDAVGTSLGSTVDFDILAENRNELNALSGKLYDEIVAHNTSFEKVEKAAYRLSYVKSPVAVPFIEKAVSQNTMVVSILVPGLERIGERSAMDALNRLAKSKNEDTRLLALDAIRRIKQKKK